MIVKDLTDSYTQYVLNEQSPEKYWDVFPELFEYYFTFWAPRHYWHSELDSEQVVEKRRLIIDRLPHIEKCFSNYGFDTKNLQIVLIVGQGTTNGHAFKHKNEFVTFLPIETYETPKQVDVFTSHEMLHAMHYTLQPDFYFNTQREKGSILRQLITEGLATYLTKDVLNISEGEAFWADYLSVEDCSKWIRSCNDMKRALFLDAKKYIEENLTSPDLFYANDPDDVRKYRAGYFIGFELVKEIMRENDLSQKDLMTIARKDFESMAKSFLKAVRNA